MLQLSLGGAEAVSICGELFDSAVANPESDLEKCLKAMSENREVARRARRSVEWKLAIASQMRSGMSMRNRWLNERLNMPPAPIPPVLVVDNFIDLTINSDHICLMKEVLVSEFKARCVGLLNEVHDSKQELLVTKRGRPLALVVPTTFPESGLRIAGDSSGCAHIDADLVETDLSADWESL